MNHLWRWVDGFKEFMTKPIGVACKSTSWSLQDLQMLDKTIKCIGLPPSLMTGYRKLEKTIPLQSNYSYCVETGTCKYHTIDTDVYFSSQTRYFKHLALRDLGCQARLILQDENDNLLISILKYLESQSGWIAISFSCS